MRLLNKPNIRISLLIAFTIFTSGCMKYLTHERSEVLLDGVDVNQTLEIAEIDIAKHKLGASLTIWAIRDQEFTPEQANIVSELYFQHIGDLKRFDEWHLTWAIANMYRLGNDEVKMVLLDAYVDAARRARNLHRLADKMVNGGTLYMGDAHAGGRAYAQKHVVVPGNREYIQSAADYTRKEKE
jgi:hypothetical protein